MGACCDSKPAKTESQEVNITEKSPANTSQGEASKSAEKKMAPQLAEQAPEAEPGTKKVDSRCKARKGTGFVKKEMLPISDDEDDEEE